MPRVLSRERCPACAKVGKDRHGDNLVTYDDGHSKCFSCGFYISGGKTFYKPLQSSQEPISHLPSDVTTEIDPRALQWLSRYFVTYNDVVEHRIMWSGYYQRLIFPVGNAWQGRYFGTENKPKWYTKGNIHGDYLHVIGEGPEVVLVEDIVSSIRLGACTASLCLFGCELPVNWVHRLVYLHRPLVIWLDRDKRLESYKMADRLRGLGFDTRVISTELDPKEYSKKVLDKILRQEYNSCKSS